MMTVNARCSNCTSWSTGSLDLRSTSQPWIFGLGPTGSVAAMLQSNSKSASIERHSKYGSLKCWTRHSKKVHDVLTWSRFVGSFTMDMVRATGGSGVLPTSYKTTVGSAVNGEISTDSNWPSIIHALCLCGALILLMPTGVVFLRISPGSVRWHWINQSLATVIAGIGIAIGFYLSTMYTKSQSYGSAHQILGIVVLLAIAAQWALGFWHHYMYKRTQSPTQLGSVHRYFGYVIFFVAILNGGIGLTWSYASKSVVIGYSVVVAILGAGLIAIFGWARWISARDQKGMSRSPFELRPLKRREDSEIWQSGDSDRPPAYHNNYDRL